MKELLKLAKTLSKLNFASESFQIIILASKKEKIKWTKPHLAEEMEELESACNKLNLDIFDLKKSWDTGKLIRLKAEDWKNLENSDSWDISSVEEATEAAKRYDRDIDSILLAKKLTAPIVLFRGGKEPYLVSGNTSLMVCKVLDYAPVVFALKI